MEESAPLGGEVTERAEVEGTISVSSEDKVCPDVADEDVANVEAER